MALSEACGRDCVVSGAATLSAAAATTQSIDNPRSSPKLMDDKRTLIAFLLVGVIFLLMPYYYELMGIAQPRVEPESVAEARRDSARVRQEEPAPTVPPAASMTALILVSSPFSQTCSRTRYKQ